MIIAVLLLIAGLALLVWGADLMVGGASRLAESLGIPKLIVGLTVIAFGTSAPELAISLQSAFSGYSGILVGNVIGSNISNILLILGIAAVLVPVQVRAKIIRVDVPVMIVCGLLFFLISLNGSIGFFDSALLVIVLSVYLYVLAKEARYTMANNKEKRPVVNKLKEFIFLVAGLAMLVYGANLMVENAVEIAVYLGMSELIIGLTIVAVGTSLPEVAAALAAVWRSEPDIVVGNVLGSNIFNILIVLGVTGLIFPDAIQIETQALWFDMPIMLVTFFACLPIFFTGYSISRWEGVLFLFYYVAYILFLVLYSKDHFAADYISNGLIFFVIPLTFITLFVISYRQWMKSKGKTEK